jgi:hypothetical protein
MMPEQGPSAGSQRNSITGTGNIVTGGTLIGSQVVAKTGPNSPNSLIEQLQAELAGARQRLAGVQDPTSDHEDALEAVDALQGVIAQDPDPDLGGLKRLRLRVKGLIGVLAPVAEVIGGVAAFEEIWRHL